MRRALISVSNKSGLKPFAGYLLKRNWEIVSTGGTYKTLLDEFGSDNVKSVEEVTESREFLGGRVKTLNETIHGGILAKPSQLSELVERNITPIDMVVANLYPFEETIASPECTPEQAIENIDIGGVTMIRGAAKNHERVTVVTAPDQYDTLTFHMEANDGEVPKEVRLDQALQAFKLTSEYDARIAEYLSQGKYKARSYEKDNDLKYGCNPHQKNSAVWYIRGSKSPFSVENGSPSYINYLDAINSWQLVRELFLATGLSSAASFKHTSPAGAAVCKPLTVEEELAYEVTMESLGGSDQALAYVRARNGDPKSSFGDFIACSGVVDIETANVIKNEVSDGIVASDYHEEAFRVLKKKKNGNFIILRANSNFENKQSEEFREMYGMALSQQPNHRDHCELLHDIKQSSVRENLLVANIALKYAQSNSVAIAKNGQIIGLGCGQQNRVDCVKLAGTKADTWHYRQKYAYVLEEWKKQGIKRQARVNKMFDMIEQWPDDHDPLERNPNDVIALASDGFFPFPDNIERAAQYGVTKILQPGGSTADSEIEKACAEHGIEQFHTGRRVFYH